MSISSIHSVSPVYVTEIKQDEELLSANFQKAFEELDVDLIIELLNQGANPDQPIKLTKKLIQSFNRNLVEKSYDREASKEGIENLLKSFDELDNQEVSEEVLKFVNRAKLIAKDLEEGLNVPDQVFKDFQVEILDSQIPSDAELKELKSVSLVPLEVAVQLNFISLVEKLIQSGAEYVDPSLNQEEAS